MENLFLKLFSENGLIAGLFILVLYGLYRIVMFLGGKAIKTYEDNLRLQREAQEVKDLQFLKSVGEISHVIKSGDDTQRIAHKELGEKIDKGHQIIGDRIDKGVEQIIKYQLKNEN